MSPRPKVPDPKKECGSKKPYPTRAQVRDKVKFEKRRGRKLRIYSCRFCGLFHLTSKVD